MSGQYFGSAGMRKAGELAATKDTKSTKGGGLTTDDTEDTDGGGRRGRGSWELEVGSWELEVGSWKLGDGRWGDISAPGPRPSTLGPRLAVAVLFLFAASSGFGQSALDDARKAAQGDLAASLKDLTAVREEIAKEKLPMAEELSKLEERLIEVRKQYDEASKVQDTKNLELNNIKAELKNRQQEADYLASLFEEYLRNLESRVHIAELQQYREGLEKARLARENAGLAPVDKLKPQMEAVLASMGRLAESAGGRAFEGRAAAADGELKPGRFLMVGPVAVFASQDGTAMGVAEQKLGSLEAAVAPLEDAAMNSGIGRLVQSGSGVMPVDPTLGNAQKLAETKESIVEHVSKGGPVMVPILGMAAAALLVALIKWLQMSKVKEVRPEIVEKLVHVLGTRGKAAAVSEANLIGDPAGKMLRAGVEHFGEPKELVEESMYEKLLEAKLVLQNKLPFIALSAASAPLLGLLGTVTGMINTFKLITVYGTGDAKTLSSGISEALITTEFGLIVAIPALLLHSYLSRRAAAVGDNMEKVALIFLNRLPSQPEAKAA